MFQIFQGDFMTSNQRVVLAESLSDASAQATYATLKKTINDEGAYSILIQERRSAGGDLAPDFLHLISQLLPKPFPERIIALQENLSDFFGKEKSLDIIEWFGAESPEQKGHSPNDSPEIPLTPLELQLLKQISQTYDVRKLKNLLDQGFSSLEISCASIFLFEGARSGDALTHLLPPESAEQSYSLEGVGPNHSLSFEEEGISLLRWVPQNCNRYLLPLSFEKQMMGFMIIEDKESIPWEFYEQLRINLSSFYKGLEMQEELQALSLYDSLTQLYNQRGFYTLGEQILRQARRMEIPVSLFYCDIDGLAEINQHRGREGGDQVLKEASSLLQGLFRKNDVLARVGSDEFAILAMGVSEENQQVILKRLEHSLEKMLSESESSIPFNVSTTVSLMSPKDPFTLRDMLTMAEFLQNEEKEGKI